MAASGQHSAVGDYAAGAVAVVPDGHPTADSRVQATTHAGSGDRRSARGLAEADTRHTDSHTGQYNERRK